MPRILIAECKQEVSSFNPVPSGYDDFVVTRGTAILERHRGANSEIGGALSVFDERGAAALVPTYSARAITSGGTLAAADWERIAAEWRAALAEAPPADGAYFSLHGAMAAENE